MATFRKRNGKWNVQIRKKSVQGSISGTFFTKSEARFWAATIEAELERGQGQFNGQPSSADVRLSVLLDRYAKEIVPQHKGWKSELSVLKLVHRRLGRLKLAELQAKDLAEFRDRRLSEVGPQTTKHALSVVNRVLVQATQEWGYVLPLGVPKVKSPKLPSGRVRRLERDEEQRLLEALSQRP